MQYILTYIQQQPYELAKKTKRGYETYYNSSDGYTLNIDQATKFSNINDAYIAIEVRGGRYTEHNWWHYIVEEFPESVKVCPDCKSVDCVGCELCGDCNCDGGCDDCSNCGLNSGDCVECLDCGDCSCDGSCCCSNCGESNCSGECDYEEEIEENEENEEADEDDEE